jgi:predicted type IV restriction endonuclease
MIQKLRDFIGRLKTNPDISSFDEAKTKLAIILPVLQFLEWDIFNADEVTPEFSVESRKVDFALRLNHTNKLFVEAKNPGIDLQKHEEQLLDYSFREGVELAVLTNGITWWFYLPTKKGRWVSRKFYTIDITQQDVNEIASKFVELLSKDNVMSGEAIKAAESIHKSREKRETIDNTLPEAWEKIIGESDTLLIDLLAETTEKICGFKPEVDDVKEFLSTHQGQILTPEKPVSPKDEKKVDIRRKKGGKVGRVSLQELVGAGLIRDGQTLFFYHAKQAFKDEKATVLSSSNKLRYEKDGEIYSISELAKILLQKHCGKRDDHQVAGPKHWQTYDGQLLNDLNEIIRKQRGDRK